MNAVYSPFQANKDKRLVYSKDTMYNLSRNPLNEYGEPDEDAIEGIKEEYIRAILHNGKPSKDRTDDGVVTKFSQSEMLLCCYSDAHSIRVGDRVQGILSGTEYEVENVDNVQEGNFAIDLSLRRVVRGIDV